jgi:hypothetical protein
MLKSSDIATWMAGPKTGGTGTHRNLYAGGRYAHLAANMAGFKGNIYVVLDIADAKTLVKLGDGGCQARRMVRPRRSTPNPKG